MNTIKIAKKQAEIFKDCFDEPTHGETFGAFIEKYTCTDFYLNISKRLEIATVFINTTNDTYTALEKNGKGFNLFSTFHYENLYACEKTEGLSVAFDCDSAIDYLSNSFSGQSKNAVTSECVVEPFLIRKAKVLKRKYVLADSAHVFYSYARGASVVKTIAIILFNLIFGCHPYKGRRYYESPVSGREEDARFFASSPSFIFDEASESENKAINGYHEDARFLWGKLSEAQREAFTKAFRGEFSVFTDFHKEWTNAFAFQNVVAKTKCNEDIPALAFSDQSVLLITQRSCGDSVRCRNYKKGMENKCEKCALPPNERDATLYCLKLNIHNMETGEVKSLMVYAGMKICRADIMGDNSWMEFFEVMQSKRADLIGLKPLIAGVSADDGKRKKEYAVGETLPLLPNLKVHMDNTYYIDIPMQKK